MCGIVGYVGEKDASEVLLDGLRMLEYRGYDSAGIAVLEDGAVDVRRCVGKLQNLDDLLLDVADCRATSASGTRAGRRTVAPRRRTPTRTAPATSC